MSNGALDIARLLMSRCNVGLRRRRVRMQLQCSFKGELRLGSLLSYQQCSPHRSKNIGVRRELSLHLSQRSIPTNNQIRRSTLQSRTDQRNAEVAFLKRGWRFAPRCNIPRRWCVRLRFRLPLNSVIGKRGVSAILCVSPRHVATDAVAISRRMSARKFPRVACQTARAIVRDGLLRLVVWIMTL